MEAEEALAPRWNPRLRRWEDQPGRPAIRRRHRGGWTRKDRRPLSQQEREALLARVERESQAAFAAQVGVARVSVWRALAGLALVAEVRQRILAGL